MNWKRFAGALVSAFLIATLLDILLNGVLLREVFEQSAQYWRPADELNKLIPPFGQLFPLRSSSSATCKPLGIQQKRLPC